MEQQIIANGGVQYVPQIAVQYVYLDFDGELTRYNGEILTIDNVEVKDSSLTEERIKNILTELNAKYAAQNVIFVTEKPTTAEYSTIYIGKTSAFDEYGNFAGLAETIDFDNQNKTDKAFVMLDSTSSNESIISTISHETDHLLGTLDHGGEGLDAYAARYDVSSGQTLYGVDLYGHSMYVSGGGIAGNTSVSWAAGLNILSGGSAYDTTVASGGTVLVLDGGLARRTDVQSGEVVVYDEGRAESTCVYSRGRLWVHSGGTATNVVEYGGKVIVAEGAYVTFAGHSFSDLTLNAGCTLHSGTTAWRLVVDSRGVVEVYSSGLANSITVNEGGHLHVYSGGKVNSVTVNNSGYMWVSSGGIACGVVLNGTYRKNAKASVSGGGHAEDIVLNSCGSLAIQSNGCANRITLNSCGSLTVASGGTATSVTWTPCRGNISVVDGALVTFTSSYSGVYFGVNDDLYEHSSKVFDRQLLYSTSMYVMPDGVVSNTTVGSGGKLYVCSGGTAVDNTVNVSGYLTVSNGGIASSNSVNSGGVMHIFNGGAAAVNTVNSSGTLVVSTGGTANSVTVNSGGTLVVASGGTASGVIWTPCAGNVDADIGAVVNYVSNYYGVYYGSNNQLLSSAQTMSGKVINNASVSMYIMSNGSANGTEVLDGGCLKISGGSGYFNYLSSGGRLEIYSGFAWYNRINSGGILQVVGGSANSNFVFSGGTLQVVGGNANSNHVYAGGTLVVSSGGTVNYARVSNGGMVVVSNGGTANNTFIQSGGRMNISSCGYHRGRLNIMQGAVISAHSGSIIDFTVTDSTCDADYLVNDLSLISGTPIYTITVAADQTAGTYKLAQGAGNFTGSITIGDGTINYGSATANEQSVWYNGITYSLKQENGDLTLEIYDITPPETPTVTLNTYALTNSDLTVTATFSDDSTVKQYKIGDGKWQDYTGEFTVSENGPVYFRAEDAVGNESTNELAISNIDKAAPAIPAGFSETISGHNATLDWLDASDTGIAGVKGYYVRYGTSEELTGDGEFMAASEFDLTDLAVGTYYYQVKTLDNANNISEWSAIQTFEITPEAIRNLRGDSSGLSWDAILCVEWYIVEYSIDNFANVITLEACTNAVDSFALPAGTYQWRVKAEDGEFVNGENIVSANSVTPQNLVSDDDGDTDLFFGNANGTWGAGYAAEHHGVLNGWSGTRKQVMLFGKNKIADVFSGSEDANILVLTDDANGDALFMDDIYTAFGKDAARLTQIDEIRAGAGDDIVDMTSQRFEYVGHGVKIYGGLGNDTIWANNGENTLFGDAGNDRLVGGCDDDIIIGGTGDDSMHGGGGDDIFCFGDDWGKDTVEQLAGGTVTLWFENGSVGNWNESTLTYTDGANTVKVSGVDTIALKFGANASLPDGCFADAASEKIFEDKDKGMLA